MRFVVQTWHKLWFSLSFILLFAVIAIPPFQVQDEVEAFWKGKNVQEENVFQRSILIIRSLRNYSLQDVEREKDAHTIRKRELGKQQLHRSDRQQIHLLRQRYVVYGSYWLAFTIFFFGICWGFNYLMHRHNLLK